MTLDEAESRGLVREARPHHHQRRTGDRRVDGERHPDRTNATFANFSTPFNFWRRVCIELANGVVGRGLATLLAVVGRMYPGNALFNPTLAPFPSSGDASPSAPPVTAAAGRETVAPRDVSASHPSASSRFVAAERRVAILLVCANPRGTDALRLGEEERAMREALRLATHRDLFTLMVLNAATIDDLRRALLRDSYGIVQFSGHANRNGLQFEDAVGHIAEPARRRSPSCCSGAVSKRWCSTPATRWVWDSPPQRDSSTRSSWKGRSKTNRRSSSPAGSTMRSARGWNITGAFDEGMSCCKLKRLPVNAVLLRKGEQPATDIRGSAEDGGEGMGEAVEVARAEDCVATAAGEAGGGEGVTRVTDEQGPEVGRGGKCSASAAK